MHMTYISRQSVVFRNLHIFEQVCRVDSGLLLVTNHESRINVALYVVHTRKVVVLKSFVVGQLFDGLYKSSFYEFMYL